MTQNSKQSPNNKTKIKSKTSVSDFHNAVMKRKGKKQIKNLKNNVIWENN